MPDREASDAVFRLSLAVLQELRGAALWMPLTYFELWMTRLMGFLPEFSECAVCGRAWSGRAGCFITRSPTAWSASTISGSHRRSCRPSRERLRRRCCGRGFPSFAEIDWPKAVCADLRKFLLQILERHIEKKLVTAGMLEKIGG